MKDKYIHKSNIDGLIRSTVDRGGLFIAPVTEAGRVVYAEVSALSEIIFDYIVPENSFKEIVFPQSEIVARYNISGKAVTMSDVTPDPETTVVFGARPCDTASIASLRSVFTSDFVDTFYAKREDALTIISIACINRDDECFCTTVNLAPDSPKGSDILLFETRIRDGYIARSLTEKGDLFIREYQEFFSSSEDREKADVVLMPPVDRINMGKVKSWLSERSNYENHVWKRLTSHCIGCGACTFSCPTCHCFDIVDEGTPYEGERRKNWDSCQFDYFTLHSSGHNPRNTQYKRWRNRFMCKFNFYPGKFSSRGCVGCGRCIRVCPVGLDITEVMEEISEISSQ